MPPILDVADLGKRFLLHERGKTVPGPSGVFFTAEPGTLVALAGASGLGKSSLLRCIYRTYLPSEGRILYSAASGEVLDLATAPEPRIVALRAQEIAFVTQFLHVLPRVSTLGTVARPLRRLGVAAVEAEARAAMLLDALGLPRHLWDVPPATFSGGERQRVNIAAGLVTQPRLLLLDEPTASLDPESRDRAIALIEAEKARGTAIVAIFHDPALVARLADRRVVLAVPVPAEAA
jgi:alpha-D-ribose 1-methylphosphonate 5-triphosphate synthase subunit PhnL